jgi:catechol 2,3-dioxygenase-like lactoylglutathione lyase family enzyme
MRMRFASIFISDEDRAIDFYVNKLGFKLVVDMPTPFGGRFLMFAPSDGGANLVATRPFPGATSAKLGGPTNIAWETDDLQATYEKLTAAGVAFTQPPKQQPWGGSEALSADQDGNIFQLHQA